MKIKNLFLVIFSFALFLGVLFLILTKIPKTEFVYSNKNNWGINRTKEINLLFLGKPGPGYIGSENTDTIFVVHFKLENPKKIYIISIPRDLVVFNHKGELKKINSLYAEKDIKTLLKVVSEYTGLDVKKYVVFDLYLVKILADALGGIEVVLDEPVADALSLYTIPPGKRILRGDDLELVLRSRYNPEGDFFRIKNQIKVLEGLKNKLISLSSKDRIFLLKLLQKNKAHWESNLTLEEIYSLVSLENELKKAEIKHILFTTKDGPLTSGYFTIENSDGVYGIYPKLGINNFSGVREYLRAELEN